MFFSLRYTIFLVYGIIILVSLLLGVYFRYYTTEYFLKAVNHETARGIGNDYMQLIWDKYYPVIGFIADKPIANAETYPEYLAFIEESNQFFTQRGIVKVTIHGDHNILYQSNHNILRNQSNFLFSIFHHHQALKPIPQLIQDKKEISVILPSVTIDNDSSNTLAIATTFIPLLVTNPLPEFQDLSQKANAILEINYDITPDVNAVEMIEWGVVGFIIISFGLLSTWVIISLRKIENSIEKQQEATEELSAARASAESESKAKSKFLANITHELRTPLNAIIGFSEIISSESMGPINNDQYKEFIQDIHTSGIHLLSLINDILDFSKAEENKLEAASEEVDLTKVLKISVKMLSPRAEQAQVTLTDELPAEHILVIADNKRLKQVVLNMLSNAVKFTPEKGSVKVKAWKNLDLNVAVIEVIDTGLGMEPQDIARALTPFGQIDNKLSKKYDGTGLGLPLTKKLVEIMKGKFEIKSEPGLGTSVTITFPLSENKQSKENE